MPARVLAGAIAVACAAVLVTASQLSADGQGHGTHEQLGLPPCSWAQAFNAPCMTCGMTTAFTHAAHGDLLASLVTQPMGMLLSIATAAGFWVALLTAATGSRLGERMLGLVNGRSLIALATLAAAAWLYKIAVWDGGSQTPFGA